MFNSIIVRYGEISLKGRNRIDFEIKLKNNIEGFLNYNNFDFSKVVIKWGRIYINDVKSVPELKKVFGIYSYSPAFEIKKKIDVLKNEVINFVDLFKNKKSFRVSCQRIDKDFPYTSVEIERDIGEILLNKTKIPVKLKNPDLNFQIEIGENSIYIFTDKIKGFGGFPFGSAGELVSLISGGIDSPVATFLMMKRGVEPIMVHFRITENDSKKVLNIKEKLEEYTSGREIKLHIIDRNDLFKGQFDKLYKDERYHSYICILCKYLMHKKAGEIAKKENVLGIITGDNLAQVASQTLKNLYAYRTVSELPVYSPLISFEKEETIKIAKDIGTYEISIQRSPGCIPPKTPRTGVSLKKFTSILKETGLY